MSQGLQIFDENGKTLLDVSDRLTRVLGSFITGISDGSHTDIRLSQGGTPFVLSELLPSDKIIIKPLVWVSGNTVFWSFSRISGSFPVERVAAKVFYGVY